MNDMKHQVSAAGGNDSSAAQLNKVPGFDPSKFLYRDASGGSKGDVPQMDLRYKKLWFRLAYPKGRMKLIAQHITEQMAIFEAQIFLDRSDNEPVGNFTATCTVEKSPNYIEVAQEAALDAALSNAGFGGQFGHGVMKSGQHVKAAQTTAAVVTAPPIRQAAQETAKTQVSAMQRQNVQTGNPAAVPQTAAQPVLKVVPPMVKEAEMQKAADSPQNTELKPKLQESTAPQQMTLASVLPNTAQDGEEELDRLPVAPLNPAIKKAEETTQAAPVSSYAQAAATKRSDPVITKQEVNTPIPTTDSVAADLSQAQETELPVAPASISSEVRQVKYTKDTPVEEILKVMTFEEAQNVVVDIGTCNGWTMAQVAERRPPSLKWYVFGCKDGNNILRAAAQIMMESLTEKKAG